MMPTFFLSKDHIAIIPSVCVTNCTIFINVIGNIDDTYVE
jgi:hypothetical protein